MFAASPADHQESAVRTSASLASLIITLAGVPAQAQDITRRPAGNFPISSSVAVPAGMSLVVLSGTLADPVDPAAPTGTVARFGDTAAQTASVLAKLAQELGAHGMTLGDVVKMNVFLVGDPGKAGAMDFEGFMRSYTKFFGAATQGRLPARTTVQVAGLPLPGALVEIEVIAAGKVGR
jgi:enamine deaminase RidA (YjgF/YER057c/UK114 family)